MAANPQPQEPPLRTAIAPSQCQLRGLDNQTADLVAYDTDPRRDLSVLGRPARIVLRGKVIA